MDDPTPVTDLVPAVLREDDPQPSSAVRDELKKSALGYGIDRPTLLSQIGHGVPLSPQQKQKLLRQATDEIVSLLPTGEVYVEGKYWRDVMNDTFGPMQWGLLSPANSIYEPAPPDAKGVKSMLYLEVFLIVKGRCVACALGAQEYFPASKRMTKDDALEGCRTNGLMRCLKNFGTFSNLWESKWSEPCRARIGVKVRTDDQYRPVQWRRLDEEPFYNEKSVLPDSPNYDAYIAKYGKGSPHQRPEPEKRAAPPPQERKLEAPPPPQEDVVESRSTGEAPEKILVIRKSSYTNTAVDPPQPGVLWVINTDVTEYVTNDDELHKALERVKHDKKRIIVTAETVRGRLGPRKRIIEYLIVD